MQLGQDHKSVAIITNFLNDYTYHDDLVFDRFDGSYKRGHLEKEQDFQWHAMVKLVEVFPRQIFSVESDITGTLDLVHVKQLLAEEAGRVNAKRYINLWSI